ncbi:MAG: hypothetical protein P1U56_16160 [Saprospiraceae bacterium]|nr:hypothetical protein [Saprospiraceae bacterium]
MKNISILLLFLFISFFGTAQDTNININIAKPKVKAVHNKENLRNNLYYIINEALINQSDFITVVERENLEFVSRKRGKLSKDDNPRVGAAVMVGANYILESKLSDVEFNDRKSPVKKVVNKKLVPKYVFSEHVKYTIDFELVNIETGEIDFQYQMNIDGLGYELRPDTLFTAKQKLVDTAMSDANDCIKTVLRYMVASLTMAKSPVVDLAEIKKDKAKTLYIQGGPHTPYRNGSKFDIIKVYTQEVGGETIEREEKIGEAKFKESFTYLTKCSISKGKKEVLTAFQEGATLFCHPVELKHLPTCSARMRSTNRTALHKGYQAAIKSDPDPNAKTISLNKKKPKNTKKVTRKSN